MKRQKGFKIGVHAWNYGKHLSDIHRLHISQSTKGKPKLWLRKPFTEKHKENMSKALTGISKPLEQRRKMSENHNPISNSNLPIGYFKDNPFSETHKLNLSIAMRGNTNGRKKR